MVLRKAQEQDLKVLLEFEQAVISAERPFNKTLIGNKVNYYDLNFLITSEDANLIIAEINNEIVASGYAMIKEIERNFYSFKKYAYLGFMYVKPEYRGKGINQKIILELTQWAKEKNISEIRLEAYSSNQKAISAYKKSGFETLEVIMRLQV
ncbi:GNAT family N-acetyltransferase [Chryseobacterium sp. MYb328]|uniref:GNAT family N-acetyltransferase n=1 Tax=Chryseobacterium sp. MYb328 TaxID=2745231 RepID=UPI0030B7ECC6